MINIAASIRISTGSLQYEMRPQTLQVPMAGDTRSALVQEISTTSTELDFGDGFTDPGYGMFRNMDDTNFVEIGVEVAETFYPLLMLKPGEYAMLRLGTDEVFARADTAAVNLLFDFLAD